jgi:hypothetical protein
MTVKPATTTAYKATSEALGRLATRRAELLAEQRKLESGDGLRHLELCRAIEAIDATARVGSAEVQSFEADARVAAHRQLRRSAAALFKALLKAARLEQELLVDGGDCHELLVQTRVLPAAIFDALDGNSAISLHVAELRRS